MSSDAPGKDAYRILQNIKAKFNEVKSDEEMADVYNNWAPKYESDVGQFGYEIPFEAAKILLGHMLASEKDLKYTKVLDVGCGTGLVAEGLKNCEFNGILHGIDGSEEMLGLARKKEIYDKLQQQILSPDKPIWTPQNGTRYDGMICAGVFMTGHLSAKMLPQLCDLLCQGGVIVMSVRTSGGNEDVIASITQEIKKLVQADIVRELKREERHHGIQWGFDEKDKIPQQTRKSSVSVFSLKKL